MAESESESESESRSRRRAYVIGPRATGWYSPDILIPAEERITIPAENQEPVDSLAFQRRVMAGLRRAETEANNALPSADTAQLDVVDGPGARRVSMSVAAADRVLKATLRAEDQLTVVETSLSALRGDLTRAAEGHPQDLSSRKRAEGTVET